MGVFGAARCEALCRHSVVTVQRELAVAVGAVVGVNESFRNVVDVRGVRE